MYIISIWNVVIERVRSLVRSYRVFMLFFMEKIKKNCVFPLVFMKSSLCWTRCECWSCALCASELLCASFSFWSPDWRGLVCVQWKSSIVIVTVYANRNDIVSVNGVHLCDRMRGRRDTEWKFINEIMRCH